MIFWDEYLFICKIRKVFKRFPDDWLVTKPDAYNGHVWKLVNNLTNINFLFKPHTAYFWAGDHDQDINKARLTYFINDFLLRRTIRKFLKVRKRKMNGLKIKSKLQQNHDIIVDIKEKLDETLTNKGRFVLKL